MLAKAARRQPKVARPEDLEEKRLWNSLEITKVVISLLTPILVIWLSYQIQSGQERIKSDDRIYDQRVSQKREIISLLRSRESALYRYAFSVYEPEPDDEIASDLALKSGAHDRKLAREEYYKYSGTWVSDMQSRFEAAEFSASDATEKSLKSAISWLDEKYVLVAKCIDDATGHPVFSVREKCESGDIDLIIESISICNDAFESAMEQLTVNGPGKIVPTVNIDGSCHED